MHSFTPVYMGVRPAVEDRPALQPRRPARAPRCSTSCQDTAPHVGDKLPYAVDDDTDYTLPVHGERRGLLHVGFEIRQDLIAAPRGQADWAYWLETLLRRLPAGLADGELGR